MERINTHPQSNIAKIKSYCRNRRQENPNGFTQQQQRVQEMITAKTAEFQNQVQALQEKLAEVKSHATQTKNRLNSLRHYLD